MPSKNGKKSTFLTFDFFFSLSCSPHPGNILVRPVGVEHLNLDTQVYSKNKAEIVLLDHGLYQEIDEKVRVNYAMLWVRLLRYVLWLQLLKYVFWSTEVHDFAG